MESKLINSILIGGLLLLTSCRPDNKSYLLNSTNKLVLCYYDAKVIEVFPDTKISYDEIRNLEALVIEIDGREIRLGEAIKKISLQYHQKTSEFVSEPHHLVVQINRNGFIYLGFETMNNERSDLFNLQPKGFPIRWKIIQ